MSPVHGTRHQPIFVVDGDDGLFPFAVLESDGSRLEGEHLGTHASLIDDFATVLVKFLQDEHPSKPLRLWNIIMRGCYFPWIFVSCVPFIGRLSGSSSNDSVLSSSDTVSSSSDSSSDVSSSPEDCRFSCFSCARLKNIQRDNCV